MANILNQHPEIINYGEVLGNWTIPYSLYLSHNWFFSSADSYLEHVYGSKAFFYLAQIYSVYSHIKAKEKIRFKLYKSIKSMGVKDFSSNLKKRNALGFLKNNRDVLVIHLYRENLFNRYVSIKLMHKKGKIDQANVLRLNVDDTIKHLQILDSEMHFENTYVSQLKNPVFTIKYEDYFKSEDSIKDHQRRIFSFLDVEPVAVTSKYKKKITAELCDVIENYDEIAGALKATKYAKYLRGKK